MTTLYQNQRDPIEGCFIFIVKLVALTVCAAFLIQVAKSGGL